MTCLGINSEAESQSRLKPATVRFSVPEALQPGKPRNQFEAESQSREAPESIPRLKAKAG